MGYYDPAQFWAAFNQAKLAMRAMEELPAPARRRVRAAAVRLLLRWRSDLLERLEDPEEKRLVNEVWEGLEVAARRAPPDASSDARTDAEHLFELVLGFVRPFRAGRARDAWKRG